MIRYGCLVLLIVVNEIGVTNDVHRSYDLSLK